MIEHRPEAPDIGRDGQHLLPARLLGRHVNWRAERGTADGKRTLHAHLTGQSEVSDVGLALRVDENVPRLEVTMQHTALVRVVNGAGDLAEMKK